MNNDFLGLGNFAWWFGVVENRLDPLELGRCQVRCFGWHTEDINQIPISSLPWAHPIVPYGVKNVQPPPEGTMVFGFFADGKEGQYPIIMGTVPGIPDEIRQNNMGFTDPYTDEQKAASDFPRKIKEYAMRTNALGLSYSDDVAKRNPSRLNEPTVSRLAHPTRVTGDDGLYQGIEPASIANTTIEIQRKTRYANVISASGYKWSEPYPSYNPMYPFNDVTETESGHAFEMDDTPEFERVQLSHRTGSTLEFLPEGHTKIKSQKSRYDVTMGNHYSYVNGSKDETVQSDMFLRINGKLIIQCAGLDISSQGPINMKGTEVSIKADGNLNLGSGGATRISGLDVEVLGSNSFRSFGGAEATMQSAATASVGGLNTLLSGGTLELEGILLKTTFGIHDFLTPLPVTAKLGKTPNSAKAPTNTAAELGPRNSPFNAPAPKTDRFSVIETVSTEQVTEPKTQSLGAAPIIPTLTGETIATIDQITGALNVKITIPQVNITDDAENPLQVSAETDTGTIDPPAFTSAAATANTTAG
jgi:hypothetical protein